MSEAASSTVQVGDQAYTIGRLSTYKMLRAGTLLTSIMREVPELSERMAEFNRKYASENTIEVSRAYAELRYDPEDLAKVSEAAWEESGGKLVIPATPGPMDMAGHVLPVVWEHVPDRLLELIALIVTPNSELRATQGDEQEIKGILDGRKEALMHEDAAEIVELLGAAADVFEEQFAGKTTALRRLGRLFGLARSEEPTTTEPTTPTSGSPSTPTDSPAGTGGESTNGSGSRSELSPASSPS